MIEMAIKAVGVMTGIISFWLLVQSAWRCMFANDTAADVCGCPGWTCHSCSDKTQCVAKPDQNNLSQENSA